MARGGWMAFQVPSMTLSIALVFRLLQAEAVVSERPLGQWLPLTRVL